MVRRFVRVDIVKSNYSRTQIQEINIFLNTGCSKDWERKVSKINIKGSTNFNSLLAVHIHIEGVINVDY